jgi:uncharacterized protein (TIRG00374 family)
MSKRRHLKTALPFFKLAFSLLLAWLVYRRVDVHQLKETLLSFSPGLLLLIYLLFLLNTCISAAKWRIFLHADGIHVPFRTLLGSYMIGTFFNIFLPSSIGGDAYRIYDISRHSPSAAHSFASVMADRLTGFLALVSLGLLAGLVGYSRLPEKKVIILPMAVCAALVLVIWLIYQQTILRNLLRATGLNRSSRLNAFADRVLGSFSAYKQRPGLFHMVMGLSTAFQLIAVFCIFMIAHALFIDIPLIYFYIFVPMVTLMEALPISIYGLGVRDLTYVLFFTQVGHTEVEALSMALAYLILTLLYSLAGGVVLLLRPAPPRLEPEPVEHGTH